MMAEIPGWAYIMIGGAVSAFSKFVESRTENNLKIFFYIGLAFIAFGIGKIIFYSTIGKSKKMSPARMRHPNPYPRMAHPRQMQQHSQQSPQGRPVRPQQALHHTHQYQQPQRQAQQEYHRVQPVKENNTPSASQHPSIVTCPACGVKHYDYANFCMMCGRQMKR